MRGMLAGAPQVIFQSVGMTSMIATPQMIMSSNGSHHQHLETTRHITAIALPSMSSNGIQTHQNDRKNSSETKSKKTQNKKTKKKRGKKEKEKEKGKKKNKNEGGCGLTGL